ncbi:MAG: hypothetical protein Q4C13_07770, partial [Clostridia bacterium]|nr:hypothetical protein [Clostridia bacterium]
WLGRHVGQYLSCEFLIGIQNLLVREGTLLEVGSSYFVLEDPETGDQMSCDFYSLRFVRVPMDGQPGAAGESGGRLRRPGSCDCGRPARTGCGAPACRRLDQ